MKHENSGLRGIKNRILAKSEKYQQLRKQRGMTLLEIIIVLGIIGVMAAGVVVLAQRAFDTKAISDLESNVNTVRVAMKDAYGSVGVYPAAAPAAAQALTPGNIAGNTSAPIATLVTIGKLSPEEARNGISGNYFNVGPANIGPGTPASGYYITLNGLNGKQCRSIIMQLGNQWDYVEVIDADNAAGTYTDSGTIDFTTGVVKAPSSPGGPIPATAGTKAGVIRSLVANNGNGLITPETAAPYCDETPINAVVLGSR